MKLRMTVRWFEHVAPSQGSLVASFPVSFPANGRHFLSSVQVGFCQEGLWLWNKVAAVTAWTVGLRSGWQDELDL